MSYVAGRGGHFRDAYPDTPKVADMHSMFHSADTFNADIGYWDFVQMIHLAIVAHLFTECRSLRKASAAA